MKLLQFLQLRDKIKRKKPDFIRQDAHKKGRVGHKWRRPKGIDSKIRLGFRGYRRGVSVGWGSPKAVKGLHKSGLNGIVIHSIKEVEELNPEKEGIIIANNVGMKKRISLINKAKERNVKILNIRNIDEYIKNIEEKVKKRKKKRDVIKKRKEKKAEKKEKTKGKLEEKIATEEGQKEEDKKEKEKKEKDRLLTKKQT